MKTRRHHKKPDEPKVKQLIDAHRARAHKHVPDRGTEQDGEAWEGFDRMKIKSKTLTAAEMANNAVDGDILASNSVGDAHINGTLTKGKISGVGNWGKDEVPAIDQLNGNLKAKDLGWADGNSFIPSGALKGVGWDDIGNKPNLVKQDDLKGFATQHWVKTHFKKS